MTSERKKIICGEASRISEDFLDPLCKNAEVSKFVYFVVFGKKLGMKLVETVSMSIGFKFTTVF